MAAGPQRSLVAKQTSDPHRQHRTLHSIDKSWTRAAPIITIPPSFFSSHSGITKPSVPSSSLQHVCFKYSLNIVFCVWFGFFNHSKTKKGDFIMWHSVAAGQLQRWKFQIQSLGSDTWSGEVMLRGLEQWIVTFSVNNRWGRMKD